MKIEKIKPIPKYILNLIKKADKQDRLNQNSQKRFYAYLTTNDKELVKVTVAVKNKGKNWYCKQVAIHGVNSKECFILDIGTTSCGFAVTDENYNILRLKGKKAWGVRLFDEAQSAEERRLLRGNRRRLERKKLKISWLQQIFKTEIEKIDNNFLTRIKYSNLWQEDKLLMNKNINSKDSLFHDNIDGHIYDDKSFYNEYPTTYHLRQELTKYPAKILDSSI